jgi:uncharacterized protein YdaT
VPIAGEWADEYRRAISESFLQQMRTKDFEKLDRAAQGMPIVRRIAENDH